MQLREVPLGSSLGVKLRFGLSPALLSLVCVPRRVLGSCELSQHPKSIPVQIRRGFLTIFGGFVGFNLGMIPAGPRMGL